MTGPNSGATWIELLIDGELQLPVSGSRFDAPKVFPLRNFDFAGLTRHVIESSQTVLSQFTARYGGAKGKRTQSPAQDDRDAAGLREAQHQLWFGAFSNPGYDLF